MEQLKFSENVQFSASYMTMLIKLLYCVNFNFILNVTFN